VRSFNIRASIWADLLFALGAIAALLVLAGWRLDSPALRGFGIADYPDWPITALSNLALSIALLSIDRIAEPARRALLVIPATVGLLALVEYLTMHPIGFDRLLFHSGVAGYALPHPGRPGLIPAVSLLAMALAAWRANHLQRDGDTIVFLLGCAMVGLAAMSLSLLALRETEFSRQSLRLAASLPATFMLLSQAAGLLVWLAKHQRGLPWSRGRGMRPVNLVLVAVLVLPAILQPIQIRMAELALLPQLPAEILGSVVNVLLVVGLLGWAIERLLREQDALGQATEALRASEEKLLIAIEAHELGLFEWDVVTGRLLWNGEAEQRLGLELGTITDFDSWQALVEPDDLKAVKRQIASVAARQADRFSFRYRLLSPDGKIHFIEGSARCFYDEAGKLVRAVGINVDVTEREEREAALKEGQAQLQSIIETVPDAMIVIGERGRILSFSAAAERLFGYRSRDVVGHNVAMLMPADHAAQHDAYLAHYRKTGERRVIGHIRTLNIRHADGHEIPIELSVGEAKVGGKRIFTGFIRDISDRVAAEAHMEQLNAEYAHGARLNAMGEMAAALAHELNQPLAATANYLGVAELSLAKSGGAARAAEAIGQANVQLLRTGEIIRRLRDFVAKRDVELQMEDLAQVIHDATALAFLGQLQVRATYDIASDAQLVVADRIQVQQVLVNVLRNAGEAVRNLPPERRIVEIAARVADDSFVEVTVADQGPGFPRKVLTNLHAPLFSIKTDGGMGVGLSISRRIIEAHGGKFSARNARDGGAVLSFTLPLYRKNQEAENAA